MKNVVHDFDYVIYEVVYNFDVRIWNFLKAEIRELMSGLEV